MRNDASPPFCEAVAEGRPGIIRPLTHSHQLFINSTNNWKKPTFSVKISCLVLIAKAQKSGFFSFQTSSFSLEERAKSWNALARGQAGSLGGITSGSSTGVRSPAGLLLDLILTKQKPGTKKHNREEKSVLWDSRDQ